MKKKIDFKRLLSAYLIGAFVLQQTSLAAFAASEITVGGELPTDTTIDHNVNDHIFNIQTSTTTSNGEIGINSFDRFNVDKGDTVNLNLIDRQNKLVNLIFDDSASQINGIVNSYMNGQIGGNVLFANPNGIVVGSSGVFNVGSLTLMTPTQETMKDLINFDVLNRPTSYNTTNIDRLISFEFDDNNYLIAGNEYEPFALSANGIEVAGKINSAQGIDLISGGEITIKPDAELNANMKFSTDGAGNVTASQKNAVISSGEASYPQKLAMQNGKNIVIVASNNNVSKDALSAIVNLEGKVDANGGDVIARTEVFQTDKAGDAKSHINVKSGTEINGNNVIMEAVSKVSETDKNMVGITDLSQEQYYGYLGEIPEILSDSFVHLASVDTAVNIENGAVINAANEVVLKSLSDMDISAGVLETVAPVVNFNFTKIASDTATVVKKGATINAGNLTVDASTDLKLATTTKTTNLIDDKIGKHAGSYAIGIITTDLDNQAVIENGAKVNIDNNLTVNASTISEHDDTTKNGLIPVVDKNRGAVGASIFFVNSEVDNKAVMNADADISGKLSVNADYKGHITSTVAGYSGGEGEPGKMSGVAKNLLMHIKGADSVKDLITRANAKFNNIDMAASVGVAVDKVNSTAQIGDRENNIKPEISAGQVEVTAKTVDEKSTLYVQSETENGKTAASGAIAVNYKDLNSDANAYGDFTLNNKNEGDSLTITATTDIIHPMAWLDWWPQFADFFSKKNWDDSGNNIRDHWNSIEANSSADYLSYLEPVGHITELYDSGAFDLLIKSIDFNNLGAYGFFNTFAQSKASAKQTVGDTKAMSGALSLALFNTDANALLDNNSTVTIQTADPDKAGINISSNASNEIWTAATLMDITNLTTFLSGASARDGSAYGGGMAFSYSDSNVIARVGENVKIVNDTAVKDSTVGDLNVTAHEDGNYLTLSVGSSSPDDTGLSGSIGMTTLGNGIVKAAIESALEDTVINANNVNVSATKDDNFVNAIISFANGQDAYGFGISGIVLTDDVESYIAGRVNARGNVKVNADYNKLIVNANLNAGIAKEGTDAPVGKLDSSGDAADDYLDMNNLFSEHIVPESLKPGFITRWKGVTERINNLKNALNLDYDFERGANPSKDTTAYAGGINANVATNEVKAYIADGADVMSNGSVDVNAASHDKTINANAVVAANGKSGAGATVMADVTNSNVQSYIGNAKVDANNSINVTAKEEYNLIAASAGIAQEKDSAGAGNVSSAVQVNNIEAAIKDGAKINTRKENANQSVKVEASADSSVIKAVGAMAIQAGGKGDTGSVGGTIDGDVVVNSVSAYIKDAEVNALKSIDVNALNDDRVIVVDVAGSASTQASAYGGTVGAYIAVNDVNAYIENSQINTKASTADKNSQSVNVKAESEFNEIAVVGTVAAGNKTGAGASVRTDVVANSVGSYIKNSTVNAGGSTKLSNSDTMKQISVAVAGSGSTSESAGSGVASILVDATDQDNYIDNSTVTTGALTLDTDKVLDTISVTGAIAAAAQGTSVGASVYAIGAQHDIDTYIKNSDIYSTGDIDLASDFDQDFLSIIFGGAGGSKVSASGALSAIVNNSSVNTYVLSEAGKNNKLHSTAGAVKVKSENDIDTITVDGNVSISTSSVSAGGAVNTTVYASDITAGIDGAEVIAKNGVDIKAKANQDHLSTVIGAAGGSSTAVEGSIDTLVMSQEMDAYLKNVNVKSDGNISVQADDELILGSAAGAVAVSTSGASVGGSILTVTMTGHANAEVNNVDVSNYNDTLGNLLVKATQSDEFTGATISGSVGSVSVAGTVDTIVINKDVKAKVNDLQNISGSEFAKAEVNASSSTDFGHGTGQVAAGTGGAGVGGAVNTLVLNKNIDAEILNSTLASKGDLKNSSSADIDITSVAMGFGGASSAAVNGTVSTHVLNVDAKSNINSSTVSAGGKLENTSSNKTDIDMYVASANGAGSAAVGGVVYSLVDNSKSEAVIDGSSKINRAGSLENHAEMNSDYLVTMFNASGAGTAAVNGTVNTMVLNSQANAIIDGAAITNAGNVGVSSNNTSDAMVVMLQASGSGEAAVNGGVNTFVSSKQSKAEIKNTTLSSTGNITVEADAGNTIDATVVGGAGAGIAAITGAVNTIVSSDKVTAGISNSTVSTTVANAANKDSGVIVTSEDTLSIVGRTGSASGAGGVAAGGAIITGVINNTVLSEILNSDVTASSADIIVNAIANEVIGSSDNPFITIAAQGSGAVAVSGAVDTLVLDSSAKALVSGKKQTGLIAGDKTSLLASGTTNIFITSGAVSGSGSTSVGATVGTLVVNKDIEAEASNTNISSTNIDIDATASDNVTNTVVAGSGAGTAGVAGAVNTVVVSSTVKSGIKNSTVNADNTNVDTKATADYLNITGGAGAGGVAGVGASVATNVIGYNASAYVENSSVSGKSADRFKTLHVNAEADSSYDLYSISGAGGGVAGVGGVISTNVVNNTVKAYVTGNSSTDGINGEKLEVIAKDTVNFNGIAGTLAGGGLAGVGATIQTNSVTSTILSYTGGKVNANDIDVNATGIQNFNDLLVLGFGGGQVGVNGSSLANIVDATTKAYVADNADITSASDMDVKAENTTTITETIGSGAVGKYAAVGATVGVNKITNTVEAYTGKNVTLDVKTADFDAKSVNNLGTDKNALSLTAGSVAAGGSLAGSVLVNQVEDHVGAYIGTGNNIDASGALSVKAQDDTKIYETVGALGVGGIAGVGASVGVNNINNTVISSIGSGSTLAMPDGNLTLNALSNETINANANVVGGGSVALSGGVLYNTIGKTVGNAEANGLSGDDAESYNSAKAQADEVLAASAGYQNDADETFKSYYNDASSDVDSAINDANNNINTYLTDAESGTSIEVKADNIAQKDSTFSLFTKSDESGSSYGSTDRNETTSAFVDTGAKINAKDVTILAKNTNDVDLRVDGNTYGGAAIGVSAGISNVNTTTNAFVSNNVVIDSTGKIDIKADSLDNQDVNVSAASGGIISGSGAIAKINSNKTTNSYILKESLLDANNDLLINANSKGIANSTVTAGAYGGVGVGVSVAGASLKGNTKIDIGDNVTLNSNQGNITIKAGTEETSTATGSAATGSLIGGSGANVTAEAGKNNTVKIGKNVNIFAKLAAAISSIAKNTATASSNGRAYGGISAGGTETHANINHTGGVNIADADANASKSIKAGSINISSSAENKVDAKTEAGAGAIAGISGSGVYTDINSNNEVYVGKNYNVQTTDGAYIVAANNRNSYKSYNDSSAYGAVGVTAGIIGNNVNSTVKAVSNANAEVNGAIEVFANNETTKAASSNYDLYGGAGGVVGIGAADLKDTITMNTYAGLGGEKAYATGAFNKGYINISSQSIVNVNEKVNVDAGGAIPAADGNVSVVSNITTKTDISNKDIKTKDDDIYYLANSDVDIYSKANIESYGGIAVATGDSVAKNNKSVTEVNFLSGVNSVSGRDTYIQAAADNNIQAYIYAATKGLIGTVGGSTATAGRNSTSAVTIAENSAIKSYDSMNVTAADSTGKLTASREAKGTTYILFGIPITIYGSGNEYKDPDNSSAKITLNGTLESGLGANKSLTMDRNGNTTSNGINITTEQVGEITAADVQEDIDAYTQNKDNKVAGINDYIEIEEQVRADAQKTYDEAEQNLTDLETENQNYTTAITNAGKIKENNNKIANLNISAGNIDDVAEAWGDAYDSIEDTVDSSFGTVLAKYAGDSNLSSVRTAWNSYKSSPTAANLTALINAVGGLDTVSDNIQDQITAIKQQSNNYAATITGSELGENVDYTNNTHLDAFVTAANRKITENKQDMTVYKQTMETAQKNIEAANAEIAKAEGQIQYVEDAFKIQLDELNAQKAQAEQEPIPVYSVIVDDIYVRSGETNISGNISGTGSITAPGNKFTVNIVNDSINDIVYNDIVIDRNVKGNINISGSNNGIKTTILNSTPEYSISITNTVDANDPTIDLGSGGYGDMVFQGDIENVNGLVSFVNNTGNVLSEGSITAKDLHISVPNGGYTQAYQTTTVEVGGTDGKGAIIASGDIDIASKIIDINGLLQSGSEIKSVTIPEFTVVKEGETYYQIVNGVKTEMTEGSDGYYYLNLEGNGELDSDLELIKAYFKPSDESNLNDIQGDIHLFKAEIQGGNITLTGNVVSSSENGKIVLVNGYGHIDITNNSDFNLVTSALNADANLNGKLTINDFKLSEDDKGGAKFDSITQSDLENPDWISQNTGTYTAQVGEDGKIHTTASGQTSGNGSWGNSTSSTREDGANVDTITYTPGDDAYVVTKAGYIEQKSYQEYVKRSWWTELWHGKLYRTVYYTVSHEPEYGVAKNTVQVQFQGFDTPQINVTSNGSVVMNSSISALNGDVNLTSTNGSIGTNNINNVISATNIGLSADNGDIGTSLQPMQTAVYNGGTLNAAGENVYINYPYSDISNIILKADGNAYLGTAGSQLGGSGSSVNITADSLELRAENGSIDLDTSKNDKINIEVNKLSARANGDIAITNKDDLKIASIVSTTRGTITLGSQNGSIIAADTGSLNPYNINGGNVILNAVNGSIGTQTDKIKVARDGIYNVNAKGDVNIYSAGRIYTDLISSTSGAVNLDADYGIIASSSTNDLVYNIYSETGVNLNSQSGNIENIAINTNGVINASAGYTDGTASGMSDISLTLISKPELSQEYLDSLTDDAEREQAYKDYTNGLKDMQIGTIKASKDIFIQAEKSVVNADKNSSLTGRQIIISSGNGNVGEEDSALNLNASRDITVFAGNGSGVYLTSDGDLNVNEIRSYRTYDAETGTSTADSVLEKVVLTSGGNITNAASGDDKINVSANNISLTAGGDIGSVIKYFTVETASGDITEGLEYSADNAYIKGLGSDMNIVGAQTTGSSNLASDENINITVNNATVEGGLTIESAADALISGSDITGNTTISSAGEAVISDSTVTGILQSTSTTASVDNMTVTGDADITTTGTTEIGTATVSGDFTNISSDTTVTEKLTVGGNTNITADNTITIADAELKDVITSSTNAKVDNMTVTGDADITTTGTTEIGTATVSGDFTNISSDTTVSEKLTVGGNTNITADNTITIADAELKDVITSSTDADIKNMTVTGNADITTTGTTEIGTATVSGDLTNTSSDTTVSEKLTVGGNTNITADNTITISDAQIGGDLNANAPVIKIDELDLKGNINSIVDDLTVNTSNDLNIGSISGNSKDYTTNVDISSDKSIFNGRNDGGTNIYAQNIDLNAGNKISTEEKPIEMLLANGNKITMVSGDSISLSTSGAGANFSEINTESIKFSTDSAINIDTLNVDSANLNTLSQNLAINNMTIGTNAVFTTGSKKIVVDNTSLRPVIDADIQMYLTKIPTKLKVDGSYNIITDSVNVTRQNEYILINLDNKYNSMNGAITSSNAASMKNTNVGEKTIEKTDKLLNKMPTVHNYVQNAIGMDGNAIRSHLIRTLQGDIVNSGNVMNVINTSMKNDNVNRLKKSQAD